MNKFQISCPCPNCFEDGGRGTLHPAENLTTLERIYLCDECGYLWETWFDFESAHLWMLAEFLKVKHNTEERGFSSHYRAIAEEFMFSIPVLEVFAYAEKALKNGKLGTTFHNGYYKFLNINKIIGNAGQTVLVLAINLDGGLVTVFPEYIDSSRLAS
jgi:hypothetical protein